MSKSSDSNWLSNYYERLQSDYELSLSRRDNVTNWSYTLLAAIIALYFSFFSDKLMISPFWRYSLVVGLLVILIRFFYQSMISYGFLLRTRFLRTEIEKHWMNGNPSIEKLTEHINDYDHGKSMPDTGRNRYLGQIRSGFILIVAIPIILITNEFYLIGNKITWEYFVVLVGLIGYVIFEIINFQTYDQMKKIGKK